MRRGSGFDGARGGESIGTSDEAVTGPAEGTATTLDIASWNIEWFGDTANGPTNEPLQLQNARDVISGADTSRASRRS